MLLIFPSSHDCNTTYSMTNRGLVTFCLDEGAIVATIKQMRIPFYRWRYC